jgi:hypothetical protein
MQVLPIERSYSSKDYYFVPLWLMCVVLLGYFPYKVYIDLNLHDTIRYEWCWFAAVIL